MAQPLVIIGANGQVGWELQRSLSVLGPVVGLTRAEIDLHSVQSINSVLHKLAPRAIVNAAAYTAVDKAEQEPAQAQAINADAPAALAKVAGELQTPFIHYSTDYVYDGSKAEPYVESDTTSPLSVYGRSKLQGDQAVLASAAQAVILRTSWVYAARGHNFLKTMLRLAGDRESLRIVADQHGAPTSAALLADVAAQVLAVMLRERDCRGVFHCTAAGSTSWHGYAQYVVSHACALGVPLKATADTIVAITTSDYPTPAKRPQNSRLNCRALEQRFGLIMPSWQSQVAHTLKEMYA